MATAAFLTAWRRLGRDAAVLVKVQLTRPTSRTLYLATAEAVTPGAPPQVWEDVITQVNPIVAPGSFGSPGLDLCSGAFVLPAGGRLAYQTGDARLIDAFADYDWHGATVTFYFWERSLYALDEEPQALLSGRVQTPAIRNGAITVHVLQQPDNREVHGGVVDDPRAPENSKGRTLPVDYGKLKAEPFRVPPWTAEYGDIATGPNGRQLIAGGRRAVPGVVTDIGRGGDAGGSTRVVFAGHKVKRIGDDTNGTAIWMEQQGKLCRMQPGVQVNNCRCASGVAQITRPSGNFLTGGVHSGALVANAIAASFPAGTRITTVAATTLGTTNPATATISVDTVGEFLDLFNEADGAGLLIGDKPSGGTDPFTTVFVPLLPSNIELVSANNAENPRAVLDPWNDTNWALLDYDAGYRELRVRFPSPSSFGDLVITGGDIFCGIELLSGSLSNTKIRVEAGTGGANFSEITLPTPSPNPGYVGMNLGTPPIWGVGGLPSRPWEFGDTIARIYFSAASSGTRFRVYALALTLRVRPVGEVVAEKVDLLPTIVQKRERNPWYMTPFAGKDYVYTTTEYMPGPVYGPPLGPFAANLEGWADDGSGTDSGLADGLIERAPDLVRHLCRTYGGFSNGDFETGASAFGSLVKLRAELKTWRQLDMEHGFAVLERTPLHQLIEALASDSLCWYHFNRFDGKLHAHAWRTGKAADYAVKIPKDWISGGRITFDKAAASEVAVSARVPYAMDHVGRTQLHEVSIGPDYSTAGHRWRGIRHQLLTVETGKNDKLDFTSNATYAVTLAAGDYDPMDLAVEVGTKMAAADGGQHPCSYGPEVVAGWNDTIRFYDGTSNKTATIAPGAYATFEALAPAIVTAINAVIASPQNAIASFSRTTRKLTIGRSSGTFSLLWLTGNVTTTRARVTVGAGPADQTGSTSYEMAYEREENRFAIGDFVPLALLWETGANGLNAAGGLKNCAALLGFDSVRDSTVAGQSSYLGHSPKGSREITCRNARDQHGGKREWSTPGLTIQDTDTALEIANRAIDLFSVPRARIRFASSYLPDMERGRVFEFEADVDQLDSVPGTVVGRRWMAVEAQQNMIPDSLDTEFTAVEVTS